MIHSKNYNLSLGQPNPRPQRVLANVVGTVFQNTGGSGAPQRWGEAFLSGVSNARGKTIVAATFYLQKVGSGSGVVNCVARDENGNVLTTIGTIQAQNLSTSEQAVQFNTNPVTLPNTLSRIHVEFSGTSNTDYIQVKTRGADQYDGVNTCLSWFVAGGFNLSAGEDAGMILYST